MKKTLKKIVASILGWQVRRLRNKHSFKLVVVAGSIGKTSTKLAIAKVLSSAMRTRYQEGNYNDIVSVPLIIFGHNMPNLFNPMAWLGIFIKNEIEISGRFPFDIVIVETGTDGPGQMSEFNKYINADLGVLTSISPEHMQFFSSIDDVANEELEIFNLAGNIVANIDLIDPKYLSDRKYVGYSLLSSSAKYNANVSKDKIIVSKNNKPLLESSSAPSRPENYSQLAAIVVADWLNVPIEKIQRGLIGLKPINGRMNRLEGLSGSLIIDDSYNASPDATKAALDYLYGIDKKHKIAVLGNMNELGSISETAHRQIGQYCKSDKLNLVITLGEDANRFTALEAENNGCEVQTCESPYQVGQILKKIMNKDTVVLVKGSQNGVFAEESIKSILLNDEDKSKLVRQSRHWLNIKQKQFRDYNV